MRIARGMSMLACVLLGAGHLVVAGQTKYGVEVKTVKPAALAQAKTYVWTPSQPSYDKNVDAWIVAAVDREMIAHGFTKHLSAPSDVLVTYASAGRTDVDATKTPPKGEAAREYSVGLLVVDLLDATTRQVLFRVRMVTPIERGPALEAGIDAAVTAMFEKYPPRPKR